VKVQGTKTLRASPEVVWEVLNDPARMAKMMPGVQSFDVLDDMHWKANVKIPLGLGALPLSFDFTKTEERAPEYARLFAKGNGVGALISLDTQFHLAPAPGGTEMKWEADVGIAGPVGSMGQRVLQPIVNQQVGNVLAALEKQVEEAGDQRGGEHAEPAGETVQEGAEEGIHPASPAAYEREPEGPTHSTEEPS
jgi:carbon monoxide dehydrogenase subunit G